MKNIVVVGGGAAGMMAAIQSAGAGHSVTLLEKNEKLGKKLFITGKGRCNITNACEISDLFSNVVSNPKFLYSSFYGFSNEDTINFFHSLGLKTKVERGNRVFPMSDKSSDVIKALQKACEQKEVVIRLNTEVRDILFEQGRVTGVWLRNGEKLLADSVILATGGLSYSSTGSDGSGYHMAERAGHTIKETRPGLTGILIKESFTADLQGLTLKNAAAVITKAGTKKKLYEGFGEILFTHYGVSGPLMLSASSLLGDWLKKESLFLHIDMKPALTREQLDKRVQKDFETAENMSVKNAMVHLLPKSMIPVLLERCAIPFDKKVNSLTREERIHIVEKMKDFDLTLTGLRDIEEAIITRGGVKTGEVNPTTMESKLLSGLYFAGEILDVGALAGGFNLQIAWSTGYAAGNQR